MPRNYEPEFKNRIIRLHIEQGRTYKSITDEYDVSKASISKWCQVFSQECQSKAESSPESPNEIEQMDQAIALKISKEQQAGELLEDVEELLVNLQHYINEPEEDINDLYDSLYEEEIMSGKPEFEAG